jgi:hypothetical protein
MSICTVPTKSNVPLKKVELPSNEIFSNGKWNISIFMPFHSMTPWNGMENIYVPLTT